MLKGFWLLDVKVIPLKLVLLSGAAMLTLGWLNSCSLEVLAGQR